MIGGTNFRLGAYHNFISILWGEIDNTRKVVIFDTKKYDVNTYNDVAFRRECFLLYMNKYGGIYIIY